MSQTVVDVVVRTKGQEKLMKLEGSFAQVSKKVDRLSRGLPVAANQINRTGRAAATASGNVQRLGVALRTTLAPVIALTAAVTIATKSLTILGDREADLNVLRTSLRGITLEANETADALVNIADRLGKDTLFDEEDFTKGFKLLTSFKRIGVDSYERVAMAAADMGTKLGTDVKASLLQLSKALEDPSKRVSDLARSGTVFTEQQKDQIRVLQESGDLLGAQNLLLKEIENQYGGAAKAAGQSGFAGAMDSLGEAWRDFSEILGTILEPLLVPVLNAFTGLMNTINAAKPGVMAYASSLGKLVGAFSPLYEALGLSSEGVAFMGKQFTKLYAVGSVVINDLAYVVNQGARVMATQISKLFGFINTALGNLVSNVDMTLSGVVRGLGKALQKAASMVAFFVDALVSMSGPGGALLKMFGVDIGEIATGPLKALGVGFQNVGGWIDSVTLRSQALIDKWGELPQIGKGLNQPLTETKNKSGGGQSGSGGAGNEQEKLVKAMASRLEKSQELVRLSEQELGLGNAIGAAEELRIKNLNAKTEIEVKYGKLQAQIVDKELEGLTASNLLLAQRNELKGEDLKLEKGLAELRESAIGDLGLDILRLQKKLQGGGALKEFDRAQEIERRHTAGGGGTSREEIGALLDTKMKLTEQDERQVELLQQQNALYNEMGNLITSTLTNSIEGLVKGTTDWNDVLSSTLKQLGQMLVQFGMNSLAGSDGQGLFSFLNGSLGTPGRASGGPVTGGNPYWVGEQGPELMVPRSNGNVIPHQQSMQLARSDAMAEYSPGGGGGGGAATPINVSYSGPQLNFDGDQYVPKAAIPELIATAAKEGARQGQARTMNGLRNSRAQRGRIGL